MRVRISLTNLRRANAKREITGRNFFAIWCRVAAVFVEAEVSKKFCCGQSRPTEAGD